MTPATEARPLLPFVYARAHNIVLLLSDGATSGWSAACAAHRPLRALLRRGRCGMA